MTPHYSSSRRFGYIKNVNVSDTRWEMCFSADLRSLVAHRIFYGVIFMAKTALPECLHHLSRLCNDECIYRRLLKQSYCRCDLTICGLTLTFDMKPLCRHKNCLQKLAAWFSQWKNRMFCWLFLFATRPFCLSLDRLLYLYYFLPFAFRKTMYVRGYKRKYIRRCGCRRQ